MKSKDQLINFLIVVNPRFRLESASLGSDKPRKDDFNWELYEMTRPDGNGGSTLASRVVWGRAKAENQTNGELLGGAITSVGGRIVPISLDQYDDIIKNFELK